MIPKILSVFDNLGQSKQALNNLGIEADVYLAECTDEDLDVAYKREVGYVGNIPLDMEYVPSVDLMLLYIPRRPTRKIIKATGRTMLEEIGKLVEAVRPRHLIAYKKYCPENFGGADIPDGRKEASDAISELFGLQRFEIDGEILGGEDTPLHCWSSVPILPISPNRIEIKDIIDRAPLIPIRDMYPDVIYDEKQRRIKGIPGVATRDQHVYYLGDQLKEVNEGRRAGNRFKLLGEDNVLYFLSSAHVEGIKGIVEPNFTQKGISGKKYAETARMRLIGRAQQITVLEHLLASWYVATQ